MCDTFVERLAWWRRFSLPVVGPDRLTPEVGNTREWKWGSLGRVGVREIPRWKKQVDAIKAHQNAAYLLWFHT